MEYLVLLLGLILIRRRSNWFDYSYWLHFEGLVQDCSNSIANALELLQSCTKPLICYSNKQYSLDEIVTISSENLNEMVYLASQWLLSLCVAKINFASVLQGHITGW